MSFKDLLNTEMLKNHLNVNEFGELIVIEDGVNPSYSVSSIFDDNLEIVDEFGSVELVDGLLHFIVRESDIIKSNIKDAIITREDTSAYRVDEVHENGDQTLILKVIKTL